ncbi:MAG: acyltransferase [Muribaculaceae bacterium]
MIVSTFNRIKGYISRRIYLQSSERYVKFLRSKGVTIGDNVHIRAPKHTLIDITRPSLVEIGNDVDINDHFILLTHDYGTFVFKKLYNDFVASSGQVKIGNNVCFGMNVTILKGVTIGDNCIIGAGSIITKDIPSNSVAVGMPCRVKCTIDEYYNRRKKEQINEAILFGKSIIKNLKRMPVLEDFKEEFGLFLPNDGCEKYPHFMTHVNMQVGGIYDGWKANHTAEFANFDEFLAAILKD